MGCRNFETSLPGYRNHSQMAVPREDRRRRRNRREMEFRLQVSHREGQCHVSQIAPGLQVYGDASFAGAGRFWNARNQRAIGAVL